MVAHDTGGLDALSVLIIVRVWTLWIAGLVHPLQNVMLGMNGAMKWNILGQIGANP